MSSVQWLAAVHGGCITDRTTSPRYRRFSSIILSAAAVECG